MTGMDALEKTALDDTKSDAEFLREKDALVEKKYGAFLANWGKKTVTWRGMVEWVEVGCQAVVKTLRPFIHDHAKRIEALEAAQAKTLADFYRGVWQPGPHKRGDAVTWEGSLFICWVDTEAKPGTNGDFKLAVKRGRDGKDLRP
jgi:hypothetical protein